MCVDEAINACLLFELEGRRDMDESEEEDEP